MRFVCSGWEEEPPQASQRTKLEHMHKCWEDIENEPCVVSASNRYKGACLGLHCLPLCLNVHHISLFFGCGMCWVRVSESGALSCFRYNQLKPSLHAPCGPPLEIRLILSYPILVYSSNHLTIDKTINWGVYSLFCVEKRVKHYTLRTCERKSMLAKA